MRMFLPSVSSLSLSVGGCAQFAPEIHGGGWDLDGVRPFTSTSVVGEVWFRVSVLVLLGVRTDVPWWRLGSCRSPAVHLHVGG
ncbi:hypothetical protein A2U01_0046326 [Trifolium medium]|uniref:Uncharacterized protein n=1 Tax=Trifolium medium TaxID=97028 RepID=A0A392QMG8_9FABA|nr:hypothetical protein [Trifolium medium]